jgi:hypothetical protein
VRFAPISDSAPLRKSGADFRNQRIGRFADVQHVGDLVHVAPVLAVLGEHLAEELGVNRETALGAGACFAATWKRGHIRQGGEVAKRL